jgi:hypothetical protein
VARSARALAALSTWLSGCDFRRPDIHIIPRQQLIPVTKAIHSFSTASQFAIVCSKNLVSTSWRSYAGIGQLTPF